MEILYPHQCTKINRDSTYAVLFQIRNCVPETYHHLILSNKQPICVGNSFVNTAKPDQLLQLLVKLFDDINKINFINNAASYVVLNNSISKNKHNLRKSIF